MHCTSSKRNKQVLRLTLAMHVLYHRLEKALNLETGPTNRTTDEKIMGMAMSMIENLEVFKGLSEMVSAFNTHAHFKD